MTCSNRVDISCAFIYWMNLKKMKDDFCLENFSMNLYVFVCLFCIKKLAGNLWIIEYLKDEYVSIQNDGKKYTFSFRLCLVSWIFLGVSLIVFCNMLSKKQSKRKKHLHYIKFISLALWTKRKKKSNEELGEKICNNFKFYLQECRFIWV